MKKFLWLFLILFSFNVCFAETIQITPVKEIKTTTKQFKLGNKYEFKNVNTGEIYTGTVVFYRPNGFAGQYAQLEISNFTDKNNKLIPGKISIIPSNHLKYQEYANCFTSSGWVMVRGSEIILRPEINVFSINTNNDNFDGYIIKIKPNQKIATTLDQIEVGDKISFIVMEDVYKNGKLFIKEGEIIIGEVDNFYENGWCADNATINLKKFTTRDINGKTQVLYSNLDINGFEILKYKSKRFAQFFNYIPTFIRGKEVDIKEYDKNVDFCIVIEN